ncbi:MAG: hypothetical protein II443_07935, partial [Oscillospiraceae bacterium]|nr:hypothetical protein [Oscillospiraceae bacterium]
MSHFDLEYVTESIRSWVGRKCKAIVLKTPGDYGPKEYVYIATSFDVIRDVFPNILILVLAMELALYDAETGRTIYRNLLDETGLSVSSVYVGGGTPTSLDEESLEAVLSALAPLAEGRE